MYTAEEIMTLKISYRTLNKSIYTHRRFVYHTCYLRQAVLCA